MITNDKTEAMKKFTTNCALIALSISTLCTFTACNKKSDNDLLTNIPAERRDVANAEVIQQLDITSDVTLTDRVNGVDYVIPSPLMVTSGTLTIQPGVTIMFEDGADILVKEEGAIYAHGQSGNTILFTSRSGKRGAWQGITVLSNSSHNVFSYCQFEHGGAATEYGKADLIIGSADNTGVAEINNCTITTSNADGLTVEQGSQVKNFTGNTFSTNTAYPVTLPLSALTFVKNGNTYYNNGKEYIHIAGKGVTELSDVIFNKLEIPYCLTGVITTAGDVTIQPGTRLYMDEQTNWTYDGQETNSTFTAIGTSAEPITIAGVYSPSGFWNSLTFKSNGSQPCMLQHCTLIGGGTSTEGKGIVNIMNASDAIQISISQCQLMNSAANGIFVEHGNVGYNNDLASVNTFSGISGQNVRIENQ